MDNKKIYRTLRFSRAGPHCRRNAEIYRLRQLRYIAVTLTLLAFALISTRPLADALMVNRSVDSSTIAQYHVEDRGIRVELEIGLDSIELFANLLPDAVYSSLGKVEVPLRERLSQFFEADFYIHADGETMPGFVTALTPGKRVLRDPISGTVLPVQLEAPDVVKAELWYPFSEEKPKTLSFGVPRGAEIGFVVYHLGVAVNDYRYLGSSYELSLDWDDPWYSSFSLPQLKRQYWAPMSGFLYIENFEVRKEIIVRPKDLQRWVDLGLEGRSDIPPALQPAIRQRIGDFLSTHQAVTIDGQPVEGVLQSVHFLERTLNSSRVIEPPELLNIESAIVGAIFVYPRDDLPDSVIMEWDLWDEKVQRIPVSAVDEAGPLPSYLEPSWPRLEWMNHLTNPTIPTLRQLELPAEPWRGLLVTLLPVFAAGVLLCLAWLLRNYKMGHPYRYPLSIAALFLLISVIALRYGNDNRPTSERAEAIVGDLLHNVYRAFDHREESDIYDVLAISVAGELLTDIFLETKRSLVLASQGGAEAKVKDVVLQGVIVQAGSGRDSFTVEADWTVHGSVGHWGHIHQRSNRYDALLTIAIEDKQWKLVNMTVLQEERL